MRESMGWERWIGFSEDDAEKFAASPPKLATENPFHLSV
jgi:hypothetical protein